MNIFVDASAWVAIITREVDAFELEKVFGAARQRLYSAISLWETTRAIGNLRRVPIDVAALEVQSFIEEFGMQLITIGEAEALAAIHAHARYGKGHHPARLNMGDCFAYACARTHDARLLYKGDDFSQTDLA